MTERSDLCFQFGPFVLDPLRRTLLKDGRPTRIRPKGFDILLVLVQAQGRLVKKDELMKAVWPDSFVEEGNVTLQISLLRKALGDDGSDHRYICNIPGRGYQFVAAVSEVRSNPSPENEQSVPGAVATGSGLSQQTPGTAAAHRDGNTPPERYPACGYPACGRHYEPSAPARRGPAGPFTRGLAG
jgi:DNA-binding winged helix-turn-helix (wHTH) protein